MNLLKILILNLCSSKTKLSSLKWEDSFGGRVYVILVTTFMGIGSLCEVIMITLVTWWHFSDQKCLMVWLYLLQSEDLKKGVKKELLF